MVKSCCAVGCHNTYKKGDTIKFYRFPADPDKRARWVAAVNRKDWIPNEYTWICSEHFLNGQRSDNPLAPNYVPSVLSMWIHRGKGNWLKTWITLSGDRT